MNHTAPERNSAHEPNATEALRSHERGMFRGRKPRPVPHAASPGQSSRPLNCEQVIGASIALGVTASDLLKVIPFCRVEQLPGIEI